ncbi:MAG TPA: tyrosine-type recombinase/integrase, partial [Actinomycetota bacterium]|nr:tyrosine-type recombinase/integrase [Actinomycetota bacterium]
MRGHVRKRRTWEFIVDIGLHPVTGRSRQKSKSGFATKKEAESALQELIRYVDAGGDPSPERIGLTDYLHRWLDHQRTRGIRSRTLDGYEGYIRREIVPAIGRLELVKVRPGHIRAVLATMQHRQLSPATIAQARSVLGSALRQAVADGFIPANPVAAVKRPRVQRRELHWPTYAQVGALLEASRGTMWEVPILLAAVTGARRSEVLGLSWEDVDLKTGTILIRRGVQPVRHFKERTAEFTPLKTKRSHRVVQLPAFALELIRRHRRAQLKRRTELGARWRDPLDDLGRPVALVCDRGDGFFIYPDSITSAFKRLAAKAGMHPDTRLHDVRHAVATELGRRGVHPVIVSAVLGHASPAFTIAVYQHAWQEGPAEAAAALQAALSHFPRWQSVGTRRGSQPQPPDAGEEISGQEGWGGEDSNLRPADYETAPDQRYLFRTLPIRLPSFPGPSRDRRGTDRCYESPQRRCSRSVMRPVECTG